MRPARVYNACGARLTHGARSSLQRDLRPLVTDQTTPPTPDDSAATRLLAAYRQRLLELLRHAELAAPREPAELRLAVGTLVEELNGDLLRLYRLAESGALLRSDQTIVVPTLERLRDTLRQRGARLQRMSDTLHKAVCVLPASG